MTEFTTEEGWHTLEDGEKLYTKTWKPTGEAKARIVFVHGFSDHCNAYGPFFPLLAERGIEVFAFDQRGWGRSVKAPKQKGLTGNTHQVLNDISSILGRFVPASSSQEKDLPLFLMGHSMGGAEIFHHAVSTDPKHSAPHKHIRGLLANAPFCALHPSTAPWSITVIAGRIASTVMPKMQMVNPLDHTLLSRDTEVCARLRDDELCHDTGTLEGLAGMLDRAAAMEQGTLRLVDGAEAGSKRSVWISHGTEDGICSFAATKKWAERDCDVKDKTWKVYEGWYHRLHDEIGDCKETYANDVANWVKARC